MILIQNLVRNVSKNFKAIQMIKNEIYENIYKTGKENYHASQIVYKFNLKEECQSSQGILDSDEYLPSTVFNTRLLKPKSQLESKIGIKPSVLEKLYEADPDLRNDINSFNLSRNISIILENGITKESIIENPYILRMNADTLQQKITELKNIKYKDINDVVPLLRISKKLLEKISDITKKEAVIFKGTQNRIYYFSQKLEVEPKIVSKYLSTRLFMFWMPLNSLMKSLNSMLEFGIEPKNLLKDLWAFRYAPDCIRERLERANLAKKDKIMPWMVRCPETIFQKSLKLSLDQNQLLGEKNSIVDYLSQRLGFDTETTKAIMSKHPAVFKVRIKKVKEVIDYLLNEAGFSTYDIARVPRVLCHKLETTKSRLEELKAHGCTPSSLVIVCRSKREYEKFLRKWITVENKIKSKLTTDIKTF